MFEDRVLGIGLIAHTAAVAGVLKPFGGSSSEATSDAERVVLLDLPSVSAPSGVGVSLAFSLYQLCRQDRPGGNAPGTDGRRDGDLNVEEKDVVLFTPATCPSMLLLPSRCTRRENGEPSTALLFPTQKLMLVKTLRLSSWGLTRGTDTRLGGGSSIGSGSGWPLRSAQLVTFVFFFSGWIALRTYSLSV